MFTSLSYCLGSLGLILSTDLTRGSVASTLFQLAWPMTIGIFAIMGFNLADTFFVGQLGTQELAAMSLTFPVVMIVGSLSFGMSIALSSLVSREIGAKDFKKVKSTTTDGLVLSMAVVCAITLVGLLTMDPVFRAMGAEGEILVLVKQYMKIWYFNIVFLIIPMVGNGAIRATGDTKFPALIMVVAGGVNVILDPLFIFGWGPIPRLELEGAAIATVLSRIVTLVAGLYVLHFRERLICRPFQNKKIMWANWKEFASIALPASLGNAIVPASMFVITAMVTDYGKDVIAGFGVGTRIEGAFTILIFGISAGLAPFVGQNYGAGDWGRIKVALGLANRAALLWCLISLVLVSFFSESIVGVFSDNQKVRDVADFYVKTIICSLFFEAILFNINSALNAMGKAKFSMALTFLRMVVFYLPLAFILKFQFQENGIFVAAAIANVLAGLAAFFLMRKLRPA